MSIRCSVLSAALLTACNAPVARAQHPTAAVPAIIAVDEASQPRDPGRIALTVGGARAEVGVTVDRATIGAEGPRDVVLLAQRGSLVILTDSYGSRPQGASRCQAGSETYARVLDLDAKRERYAKLVESCLKPVISGSPAYTVAPDRRSVTFNLIEQPAVTLTLDDHGGVSVRP